MFDKNELLKVASAVRTDGVTVVSHKKIMEKAGQARKLTLIAAIKNK